jgi:multiple sugar transport system substrate-binding protein
MSVCGGSSSRRSGPAISRRRFLYGAATALGGLALTGCGNISIAGRGRTVDFWNLFGGGDGARLAAMESDFVKSHPGIELKATTLTWGAPYYTKVSMATVGGRPPDVAVMHLTRLPAYAPAGLLEPLDPDVLSEYDIGQDKFLPEIWEGGKLGMVTLEQDLARLLRERKITPETAMNYANNKRRLQQILQ